jgi:hypothetical protein
MLALAEQPAPTRKIARPRRPCISPMSCAMGATRVNPSCSRASRRSRARCWTVRARRPGLLSSTFGRPNQELGESTDLHLSMSPNFVQGKTRSEHYAILTKRPHHAPPAHTAPPVGSFAAEILHGYGSPPTRQEIYIDVSQNAPAVGNTNCRSQICFRPRILRV